MDFGDRLRKLREASGLSQHALADAAKVSRNSIMNYETHRRMPKDLGIVNRLASALATDIYALMDEKDYILMDAEEKGGAKARRDLQVLSNQVTALFAGGELGDDDMEAALRAITEAYWIAKEVNKKYTPKKYRRAEKAASKPD